jgi:hypothetical protein
MALKEAIQPSQLPLSRLLREQAMLMFCPVVEKAVGAVQMLLLGVSEMEHKNCAHPSPLSHSRINHSIISLSRAILSPSPQVITPPLTEFPRLDNHVSHLHSQSNDTHSASSHELDTQPSYLPQSISTGIHTLSKS